MKKKCIALRDYLETLEMEIITAHYGEEAILQDNPKPDVILMDMMMPVMDDYETLKIIKYIDELKSIPVIAVEENCLETGSWDYISKPINIKMLIEKMNRWMV